MPQGGLGGIACGMAAFVKPSEIKAVVVESTDSLAVALVKVFVRFPVLMARVFMWSLNEDGTFSAELKAILCAACPEEEES